MIEIVNFTKSYPGVPLYKDFNLRLKEGEITCILGESGCGKTTLLNAVAGLTSYEGKITDVRCSYVFQTPRLVPSLTVYGNLKLVCKEDDKIREMLSRVRLREKEKSYPVQLSGGQAQRVSIARAFLYAGDVILLDEPFSSLDLKLKAEMMRLFYEIWRSDGRTALMVTHDADEALSLAHRLIVIDRGRVKFDLSPEEDPPRSLGNCESLRKKLICALLDEQENS